MGLVEHCVSSNELLDKAFAIGEQIATNPDTQLRMTKKLLTENATTTDLDAAQKLETKFLHECWETPEHEEAVNAFLEKRPAHFR